MGTTAIKDAVQKIRHRCFASGERCRSIYSCKDTPRTDRRRLFDERGAPCNKNLSLVQGDTCSWYLSRSVFYQF